MTTINGLTVILLCVSKCVSRDDLSTGVHRRVTIGARSAAACIITEPR